MGWLHVGWWICNQLWGAERIAISGPRVDYHHYRANRLMFYRSARPFKKFEKIPLKGKSEPLY
ncbi:MAG: hypothetical protein ACRCWT_13555, partial [Aeromonas veronii]